MTRPRLSVVVPLYNAPENLARCLAGLAASELDDFELVLVDDCSTDERAVGLARDLDARGRARYHRMPQNGGPGIARNAGAALATGDVLVFVDSDVVLHADTLARIADCFAEHPQAAAVFGSYDDAPAARGFVTEYRNLLHHYTHQTGPQRATTFWAGCGAIRREVFERHGGFDAVYKRPCIEDIELGMRLDAAGDVILLRPEIQCTHLKRWRFSEMVRVDVTCRAIPWTHLLIERPATGGDLNLGWSQKLCVGFTFLALLLPLVGGLFATELLGWGWLAAGAVCLVPVVWINRGLYRVLCTHRGLAFGVAALLLHWFYYLYSGCAFVWAQLSYRLGGVRTGTRASNA